MKKREKFISQCCVCKKIKRKEGFKFTGSEHEHMDEWDHHEEDLKKLHEEFDIVLSHGFCEPCADEWVKNLGKDSL